MASSADNLIIPHQTSRPFVNAADIYKTSLDYLSSRCNGPLTQLEFRFQQPLGSYVEAAIYDSPPSSSNDAQIQFVSDGVRRWLGLRNQNGELKFDSLYSFDESEIQNSIVEKDGELRFIKSVGPSNIHQLSAAIKYAWPKWPKDPSRVRNVKLRFLRDVQTVDIREISWRIHPRETFNVTTYSLCGEPFGEALHFFLEEKTIG